jgi:hypothetical protein
MLPVSMYLQLWLWCKPLGWISSFISYRTGITPVDSEHKILFALIRGSKKLLVASSLVCGPFDCVDGLLAWFDVHPSEFLMIVALAKGRYCKFLNTDVKFAAN